MTSSTPDFWEDIRDICGWMFGGIISEIGLLLMLGGRPPAFAPAAFLLGLTILPPVVDVIRMIVPYWRWTFVPTGAFVLGLVVLIGSIVVDSWPLP
jgi:hypothetical protein